MLNHFIICRLIGSLLITLCYWSSGSCQKFKFDHYGIEQGFYASQALSIDKSRDGFLWIGTENGLYRFDGHQFKGYFYDPSNQNSFSGNYINKVIIDKHNRLWAVANVNSINIFDVDSNKVLRYQDPSLGIISGEIKIYCMIYLEIKDEIWVNTNIGLFYSQGIDIQLKKYEIKDINTTYINTNITIDKASNMWFVNSLGLHHYNSKTKKAITFINPYNITKNPEKNDFVTLLSEGDSIVWVGGWSTGLYKYDIKKQSWRRYLCTPLKNLSNSVGNLYQDKTRENILWLASSAGLQTFDKKTKRFTSYFTDNVYDPYGVTGDCYSFLDTKSEGLWIGTKKGLHKVDPYVQYFNNIDLPELTKYFKPTPTFMTFEKNNGIKDSVIWFVLPYNEIIKYDLVNGKLLTIPDLLKPYCMDKIEPLFTYIDSRNTLWLASNNKGLVAYDLSKKKLTIYLDEKGNKFFPFDVKEDKKGKMWFGTSAGLYHLRGNQLIFNENINKYLNNIGAKPYVFEFELDSKDNIWFIPNSGKNRNILLRYSILEDKIIKYDAITNKEIRLLDHIESVKIYDENKIVLTSSFGFATGKINDEGIQLTYHNEVHDHPINGTFNIGEDSFYIYITCDLGIISYDKKDGNFHFVSSNNSNLGEGSRPYMAYSKVSKTLYIGHPAYFQTISRQSSKMKSPFKLLMTSLIVNDSIFSILPKSGDTLLLDHYQNSLKFRFSSFNFTNASETVYEYRLNESKNWERASTNVLNFERMRSGRHQLCVRSSNWYTSPSDQVFILYIEISYPWHQTWWFQVLVLLSITGFIYSIFKYRDFQRQRLEKLRLSIARDLHDDLGSNLSHIKMLSERESMRQKTPSGYTTIANKTAEIMNSMSEIIWTLNPKFESLDLLFGKIQEFAIDTLEPLGIEVNFNIDVSIHTIKLSPEERRHFYLIFKEAINNAAKYSKASKVELSLQTKSNHVYASFKDNGLGFDPLLISKGNGLKNMLERASMLDAKFEIVTNEQGTIVTLSLPTRKRHHF